MKVNTPRKHFSMRMFSLVFAASVSLGVSARADDPAPGKGTDAGDQKATEERTEASLPTTVEEARGRARWLHEGFHGALQVMHRDFFDDEDTGSLPSQSLDDVFKEMARSWSVEIRWLGVNATKGINHNPKDRFEEKAAAALESGEKEYEQIEAGRYRYVGMIRLQNECLKCHVRDRATLEDRVAGLAISFPLRIE